MRIAAVLTILGGLACGGCTSLSGYADDPQPDAALAALRTKYFSPEVNDCYNAGDCRSALGIAGKQAIRDDVVLNRMHVYDMEFTLLIRNLSGGNNILSVGSDLTALTLNGLAATTGNAPTKAALAAASAGVIGANGAINKDLFYEKTVPALVTQMDADRTKVEAAILVSLKLSDADYPLQRAVLDLDRLNDAGSINGAVASITHTATGEKNDAQALTTPYRTLDFAGNSTTRQRLEAWLAANPGNNAKLQAWLKLNAPANLKDVPLAMIVFGNNADTEALRAKAVADPALAIP